MKSFKDVMEVVEKTGEECPWDKEQTIASLKKHLKDEAQEVLDAIDNNDMENLKEELGDMIWIVAMMADLARKDKHFTIDDVLSELRAKIVRRHPHVFGDKKAETAEEAIKHFNDAKKNERKTSTGR